MFLITGLMIPQIFNATRNFMKIQELFRKNPEAPVIDYFCSSYHKGVGCDIYVLAVERDARFYPNKYIIITKYTSGRLLVDLLSEPNQSAIQLEGETAWQYLAATHLDLPR
jgi:hypothetical protein